MQNDCVTLLKDNLLHDLVENYANIAGKKRDTPDAQNWLRREAPRPILCAACVAFFCVQFWRSFGVNLKQIVQ